MTTALEQPIDWDRWRTAWDLDPTVTYLNHGSFGLSPLEVQMVRQGWSQRVERDPMRFFCYELGPELRIGLESLSTLLHTEPENLAFVDNATFGMNAIADTIPLQPGDEVLTNNHEYGACLRIWERACQRADAKLVRQHLPLPIESEAQMIETLFAGVTERTKVVVFSHITSPTALIFPVKQLCQRAKKLGLIVVIDGPHAPAAVPVNLAELDCDFYTASCHKWLCAPFGAGVLYVDPKWQERLVPSVLSWGRIPGSHRACWQDDFHWLGTRDPSAFLAVTAAIDFMQRVGLEAFRQQTYHLARHAAEEIGQFTGLGPIAPQEMFGLMVTLPLPPDDYSQLQRNLWEQAKIEIPIFPWDEKFYLRVSCHLYNRPEDIEVLVRWLKKLL